MFLLPLTLFSTEVLIGWTALRVNSYDELRLGYSDSARKTDGFLMFSIIPGSGSISSPCHLFHVPVPVGNKLRRSSQVT